MELDIKRCGVCRRVKGVEAFWRSQRDGWQAACKVCQRLQRAARYDRAEEFRRSEASRRQRRDYERTPARRAAKTIWRKSAQGKLSGQLSDARRRYRVYPTPERAETVRILAEDHARLRAALADDPYHWRHFLPCPRRQPSN